MSQRWEQEKRAIAHRNAQITSTPAWPRPWFLSDELERVAAAEISERPLHGVPSVYRTQVECLTRIVAEKIVSDEMSKAVPRRVRVTFLSVSDQIAMRKRLANPLTDPYLAQQLRVRLRAHRRCRG